MVCIHLQYFGIKVCREVGDELRQRAIGSDTPPPLPDVELEPRTLLEIEAVLEVGCQMTLLVDMGIYCNNGKDDKDRRRSQLSSR